MPPTNVQVMQIGPFSDGTGVGPGPDLGMVQNDGYFEEKIAERWAKDRGIFQPGPVYRLEQLPFGFHGFQRQRENTKHIDRFFYGHPKGPFRSINELFPHFKHLQEHESSYGCPCKLCTGTKNASDAASNSGSSSSTKQQPPPKFKARPKGSLLSQISSPDVPTRQKQIDELGTPDVYRKLLDQLKASGTINQSIVETLSPDWRAGHTMLMRALDQWQSLPDYVPRGGEIVLFLRTSMSALGWDTGSQTLRQTADRTWLDCPQWEAGVVTQLPVEPINIADVSGSEGKMQNVTLSGFRIEPLQDPHDTDKPLMLKHKYVALHAIRPLCFWKQCIPSMSNSHPSIRHALTVACSFCIVGKYQFKGTWPDATVFARAVYLGAELIIVGDTVRLLPRTGHQPGHTVTDIMVVTSIRLRFVNLGEASEDDYDDERPYTTCLHISGRVFTRDPKRSFGGIGKAPVQQSDSHFPAQMQGYGPWFHLLDPLNLKARLEVPYTRVMGRCYGQAAVKAWFPKSLDMPLDTTPLGPASAAQANEHPGDLSQGLTGVREAQRYSQDHDIRIERAAGKLWFWADSRIEQLDLHEVNGRRVGAKDEDRTKGHMSVLRKALKLLDGKKGGLEEYLAERKRSKVTSEQKISGKPAANSWGLVAGSSLGYDAESSTDHEQDHDENEMEIDEEIKETPPASQAVGVDMAAPVMVYDSDDEMYE